VAVFEGERLVEGPCPLLIAERSGEANKPPVVFFPGALHTARIGYGLPHDRPEDFVGHWLGEAGHPFVAVSYPVAVGDPAFENVDPALQLDQLADAAAAAVGEILDRRGWHRNVIVAAWSALGNIAPRLRTALTDVGVELGTFVSLAATPPLPNLILGSTDASTATVGGAEHYTAAGLLRHTSLRSESFVAELDRIDGDLGRTVVARDDYRTHHMGDMPLELFPGLEAVRHGDAARIEHEGPLAISNGAAWAAYPLCAAVWPTLRSDQRHALTDRHNWGMVNANALTWRVLRDAPDVSDAVWDRVLDVSHRLASELHRRVHGGHLFFVGEPGARATAEAIIDLDRQRADLEHTLLELIGA